MRRFVLWLTVAALALVAAPAALADGPLGVSQGGSGVASPNRPNLHYVAIGDRRDGTIVETVDLSTGGVWGWGRVSGSWGIPVVGAQRLGQGLSGDGKTLVLVDPRGYLASPTKFLVFDAERMRALRTISLAGTFTFDALSPNASRLYLIQYKSATDQTHYIVRAYDMRTNRLLPGKIADRSEDEKLMAGSAVTRVTSADGRWVYTLYQKPSGGAFVHALDTVRAVAHCIDLPANGEIYSVVLSLRDGGRTLAADREQGGRRWLNVDVGSTWRISYPSSGVPWAWIGAGVGGGLAVLAAAAVLLRRRRGGEEVEEHAGQALGLA